MVTTKIYRNDSKKKLTVPGLGDLKPGEQISVTSEYHQPVVLPNYPGLVEVVEEERRAADQKAEKENK